MKGTTGLCGLLLAALLPAAAYAQAATQAQTAPQQEPSITDQIDIAGSFYETLTTKSVTGSGVTQTSSNSVGGMFEVRRIQSPWLGYEIAYSLNPDNQTITPVAGACSYYCSLPAQPLTVKDHQFTLDWVGSRQYGNLRPFVVGGFGFTIAVPVGITGTYLSSVVKPTYVGGAGVDVGFGSRLGLRVQYHESFFTAPHLDPDYPNTRGFTPEGMPIVGVVFHL